MKGRPKKKTNQVTFNKTALDRKGDVWKMKLKKKCRQKESFVEDEDEVSEALGA